MLLRCFYSFGDDFQIQGMTKLNDRLDDRRAFRIVGDVPDKRLIDLQFVDGQMLQIGEAGVAGAEIVDGYFDP